MALTRRDIADDFDSVDEQIADLNEHKRQVLTDYRAQLAADGMSKDQIKLEVEATKAAIKRLRAKAKDADLVEEKDALVDEIEDEISRSRARRTTRVEPIEQFPVEHDEDGVFPDDEPQSAPTAQMRAAADGPFTSPAGAEGIVDRQPIQPETATPVHSIEGVNEPHLTVADDANAGGEHEASVTDAPIETETADTMSSGLDIENTVERDGASEASVSSVEIAAPIYADPGIIVMESCPPVGIVAHPYAACWPVNTVDVTNGVERPIVKIGHLILDGRGRYFAARAAHIEYPVVQYDGDDDLADSIAWNVAARPNMDPRALRIVAQKLAKLAPDRAEEILERMGLAQISEAAE